MLTSEPVPGKLYESAHPLDSVTTELPVAVQDHWGPRIQPFTPFLFLESKVVPRTETQSSMYIKVIVGEETLWLYTSFFANCHGPYWGHIREVSDA
jgi:hypothetical protein